MDYGRSGVGKPGSAPHPAADSEREGIHPGCTGDAAASTSIVSYPDQTCMNSWPIRYERAAQPIVGRRGEPSAIIRRVVVHRLLGQHTDVTRQSRFNTENPKSRPIQHGH